MNATVCTALPGGACLRVTAQSLQAADAARSEVLLGFDNMPRSISHSKASRTDLQAALRTARMLDGEPAQAAQVEITFGLQGALPADFPGDVLLALAQLNAVLAERSLRGLWAASRIWTVGCIGEGDWERAMLQALPGPWQQRCLEALSARPPEDLRGCQLILPSAAQADPVVVTLLEAIKTCHPQAHCLLASHVRPEGGHAGDMRSAKVWFPIAGAQEGAGLEPLELMLRRVTSAASAGIEVVGPASPAIAEQVRELLHATRRLGRLDAQGLYWQTLVRLPALAFNGQSYQLALLLADRMAHGCEFHMPPGRRLFATGALHLTDTGCEVHLPPERAAMLQKCALLLRNAGRGDRVLLPGNWASALQETTPAFAERGISLAFVRHPVAVP